MSPPTSPYVALNVKIESVVRLGKKKNTRMGTATASVPAQKAAICRSVMGVRKKYRQPSMTRNSEKAA